MLSVVGEDGAVAPARFELGRGNELRCVVLEAAGLRAARSVDADEIIAAFAAEHGEELEHFRIGAAPRDHRRERAIDLERDPMLLADGEQERQQRAILLRGRTMRLPVVRAAARGLEAQELHLVAAAGARVLHDLLEMRKARARDDGVDAYVRVVAAQ